MKHVAQSSLWTSAGPAGSVVEGIGVVGQCLVVLLVCHLGQLFGEVGDRLLELSRGHLSAKLVLYLDQKLAGRGHIASSQ